MLALLRTHRDYWLIIDLRDNLGGENEPFQSLISGLPTDPWRKARCQVIGLVDQFTDSAATGDAYLLNQAGTALISQPPADPIDEWGTEQTFRLPDSGLLIQYTTATINTSGPGGASQTSSSSRTSWPRSAGRSPGRDDLEPSSQNRTR